MRRRFIPCPRPNNRRVSIIPGLRVNFSKSGASLSIGHRGFWWTIGPKGQRATIGLPGSGVYWTKQYPPAHPHAGPPTHMALPHSGSAPNRADQAAFLIFILVMVGLVVLAAALALGPLTDASPGSA